VCWSLKLTQEISIVSKTLIFEQEGETVVLDVRRLIYHGNFHFTSCIIQTDGIVWYHDGMTTESSCENEGDFDKFSSKKLLRCKRKKQILVVYTRVYSEGGKWKWVGGWMGGCIYFLFPSAIQMACVIFLFFFRLKIT